MAGLLRGLVILLVVLWVVFKPDVGIAGVSVRLPLVADVVVVVYDVIWGRGVGAVVSGEQTRMLLSVSRT